MSYNQKKRKFRKTWTKVGKNETNLIAKIEEREDKKARPAKGQSKL